MNAFHYVCIFVPKQFDCVIMSKETDREKPPVMKQLTDVQRIRNTLWARSTVLSYIYNIFSVLIA